MFGRTQITLAFALASVIAGCGGTTPGGGATPPADDSKGAQLSHPGEIRISNIVQLTRDSGENAEAYWSFDGKELIFQTTRPPYDCDQIMRMPADGSGEPQLVSTGTGRTTCAYFLPGNQRTVWSSTHLTSEECPAPPDHSMGYVWALYDSYEVLASNPDGTDIVKLTDQPGYDAEATVCGVDGSIIFTSTRDGDLELYRMDADGKNVKRLTNTPGYDGGAFFSQDCKQIVWRASRPTGEALADYKRLLGQGLVRPSKLELFVANADGSDPRQVTYLDAATFAPFFHPSGTRILFSSNYPDPRGREFDIWSINVDGTGLERVTYAPGFDGFPMFSPDGTKLAFASNRNQAKKGETDIFVADWNEDNVGVSTPNEVDHFLRDVKWLADDKREGRGVGSRGLDDAVEWLSKSFSDYGVDKPQGWTSYRQVLDVPVSVERGAGNSLNISGSDVAAEQFVPASFTSNGGARARSVFVDYGIVAPEIGVDHYKGKRVKGKIVVVRRFVPDGAPFDNDDVKRRYSDLHYKAFTARERGAIGVIVIDKPASAKGKEIPDEAPLPELRLSRLSGVGIPVMVVKRELADRLLKKSSRVAMATELVVQEKKASNVIGVIPAATATKRTIVVGAHLDHLGMGGDSSLEPGVSAVHNGADDNASGIAGLKRVARVILDSRETLKANVVLAAFTAEESGLLGSSHFVEHLPGIAASDIVAMLNMDMIGRMRANTVAILGGATATEWPAIVDPVCSNHRVVCTLGGDGYGPSDHTPFYADGIPVLHFFTGAHGDYHKTTDDIGAINAAGGARVAKVVADVVLAVADGTGLSYQKVAAPLPQGDSRSFGASLGTIPDYANASKEPGVPLSGVRVGGPADQAGMRKGDRLIRVGVTDVRSVQDLVYVLRNAKPGQRVTAVVVREGKEVSLPVTFGTSQRKGKH